MQKNEKYKYNMLRNTVFNAGANLMRGKNSKEVPLFDESLNGEVENNAEQNKNETY